MTKDQAVAHYGSQSAIAKVLGLHPQAVIQWRAIPPLRQLQLELHSAGRLVADAHCKAPAPA